MKNNSLKFKVQSSKFKITFIIGVILFCFAIWIAFHWPFSIARGGQGANVRGWAWSENIGWASANCFNDYDNDGDWENCCAGGTTCPAGVTQSGTDYGLTYETIDNTLSGWGWSENVGWICFGSDCSGTAPDGNSPWACVGKRRPDCGEEFNVPGQLSCTTEDGTEDANLIAHWKFNDGSGTSAKDSSANTNTGTLMPNGSEPIWYVGKWDKALKFDGENDYVDCGTDVGDSLDGASELTIEGWFKLDTVDSDDGLFSIRLSGDGDWFWNIRPGGTKFWIGYKTSNDSGYREIDNPFSGEAGHWVHLATTYSSGHLKTYKNGVEIDDYTVPTGTVSISTNAVTYIGSYATPGSYTADGIIDNVAIYDREKSAEEIWDDAYAEPSCFKDCGEEFNVPGQFSCTTEDGTEDANLVAHWKFNDGGGTSAKDYSANTNTGTLMPSGSEPIWYVGKWDKALKFDGTNDYVNVSHSSSLDITGNAITIEAWVKVNSYPTGDMHFVDKIGSYYLGMLNTSPYNTLRGGIWGSDAVGDTVLELGRWYHVAMTYDGAEVQLWLDGKKDGDPVSRTANIPHSTSDVHIGSTTDTGNVFFHGLIDNVAIYNRAKSAEEIWDDAHIEISGWAKVESLDDEGWLRLKGQTSGGDWYGFSLTSWAGTYYTLDGYSWNGNLPTSSAGIGWLKGGYHYSGAPIDKDNFSLSTSSAYCYIDEGAKKTQMFLSWDPALWAEAYTINRCDNVESCQGCDYGFITALSPEECSATECSYQDTGLAEDTGYCWKVIASNSQSTEEIEITPSPQWGKTPLCAPIASVNTEVCGIIKPIWESETSAIGYNIYRSQASDGCSVGDPSDDSAADIRSKVNQGTCKLIGHLAEGLDYRGAVGHWTMNESSWSGASGEVRDSSGEGNHGRAMCAGQGCTLPSPVNGLFSNAGNFDGSEDYIRFLDDSSLDLTDELTIEEWIYGNSFGSGTDLNMIVAKWDDDENNRGYMFKVGSLEGDYDDLTVVFDSLGDWSQHIRVTGPSVSTGVWHHVAVTYDNSLGSDNIKIYLDGELRTTANWTQSIYANAANLLIGAYDGVDNGLNGGANSRFFNGLIDNVAIYNRAKSAEEIKIDYEAGRCERGSPSYCAVGKTCSTVTCGDLAEVCNTDNCGESDKCCYIDRRIIPRLGYYYRITSLTKDGGESPPSSINGASTLCYPPTEMIEE